ncbi:MAG: ankyrin repeat domain-containing protein [Solirubrobacterales bacterium]
MKNSGITMPPPAKTIVVLLAALPGIVLIGLMIIHVKDYVLPVTHLGFHREPRWLEWQMLFWIGAIAASVVVLIIPPLRKVYRLYLISIVIAGLCTYLITDLVIYRYYLHEIGMYDLYENGQYEEFLRRLADYDMKAQQEGMLFSFLTNEKETPEKDKVIFKLFKNGMDYRFCEGYGWFSPQKDRRSYISLAAEGHYTVLIDFFIKKGFDVSVKDNLGETPLFYAVSSWDNSEEARETIRMLLKNGADINAKNNLGENALLSYLNYPVREWDPRDEKETYQLIVFLADAGLALDEQSGLGGNAALHLACQSFDCGAVQALLEKGADVNIRNGDKTPMMVLMNEPIYNHDKKHHKAAQAKIKEMLIQYGASE